MKNFSFGRHVTLPTHHSLFKSSILLGAFFFGLLALGTSASALTASGPVTASSNGQIIENLDITSTNGDGIYVNGKSDVIIRNVRIKHKGGSGISANSAARLQIQNVDITYTGAPASGANPGEFNNIDLNASADVVVTNARLTRGSTGIYLVDSPRANLSFIEGHDFRGPFPRGQVVQFNASHNGKLTDFSVINPMNTSWTEDNVNVYHSNAVTIQRGFIDGNNSPSGVGVIIEADGFATGSLVEDVDTIRMGNGAFSASSGTSNNSGSIFRRVHSRENICGNLAGRGTPSSNALMFHSYNGAQHTRFEQAQYWASCNGNISWDEATMDVADFTEVNYTQRAPIVLVFPWESGGTPAPTATLAANPTSITTGGSSTLTWSSTNATSCTGTGFTASATSGSVSVSPAATQTYSISCTGAGGTTNASATVTVSANPPTVTLAANPTSVTSGGSSTLTWSSTNATSCTASGGWSGAKATSGSQSLTNLTATATYTLSCTGSGGTVNRSTTVTVTTAADTTAPSVPTNLAGSGVSSSQINLSWTASTDNVAATGYKVFRNGVQVGTSATASYNDSGLSINTAYTYTVSAYDAAGNNSAQASSISVSTLPTTASFVVGDRIQATANLNVRATPSTSGALLGTQTSGALGTLVGGPTIANGFIWWNINYDTGVDGWSVQDYLAKVSSIPTVSLSANPASITSGGSSTLTWSSTNATACTGTGFTAGAISGSVSVSPTSNTTYSISCAGAGGAANASATVTVSTGTGGPTDAVGYWKFDEGTGTSATDSSGNGNAGTLADSPIWTTGQTGNALSFNGTSAAVNIPASTRYDTTSFTTSFWIKPLSLHAGDQYKNVIMGREIYNTKGFRFGLSSTGAPIFWTTESGGTVELHSPTNLALNTFSLVTLTYNGSVATVYVNGIAAGSVTGTYVPPTGVTLTVDGGPGGTTPSNSVIDDVRWYNRALSASEVSALYSGTPTGVTATLTANPTSITSGGSSVLYWSSTNATSCTGTGFTAGAVSGSVSVSPTSNTTYSVSCSGAGGTASASAVITTSASGGLTIGSRIQTTARLSVRPGPSRNNTRLCTQPAGALGTIVDGPQTGSGYTWWNINYDAKCDGWSVQDFLKQI